MNKIYLLYFFVLLFIFNIYINNKKETFSNLTNNNFTNNNFTNNNFNLVKNELFNNKIIKIPEIILMSFEKISFLELVSKYKITYLQYYKNNLNADKYITTTVDTFMKKTNDVNNRYQIKQTFDNNDLSKYILKYGYEPIVNHFKLTNTKPGDIRISKNRWSFGYHYDCINIILVQLIGTRIVYTKKNKTSTSHKKYKLNPGSMLYIPMKLYHKVNVLSDLNLNFTIMIKYNTKKMYDCNLQFNEDFNIQSNKCKYNNCI